MHQKTEFGTKFPFLVACFAYDLYSWDEITLFQFSDALQSLNAFSEHELDGCKVVKNEIQDLFSAVRHQTLQEAPDSGMPDACLNN